MAKSLNPEQMQDSLERGSFDKCIGVVEDHQLECKKEPYHIQRDDQRQEFAKDVTALANAEGGVILIGVRTEKNPTHFGDEITSIYPFPQDLVNPNQWDAILQIWVYPSLQGVNMRWYPSASDPQKGVGVLLTALLIPPLLARIRAEEQLLRTQFGREYEVYCTRTWRLTPGLY